MEICTCGNCNYAAKGMYGVLYCVAQKDAPSVDPGGCCRRWQSRKAPTNQTESSTTSQRADEVSATFRATVVPERIDIGKRQPIRARVKIKDGQVLRGVTLCGNCDKWTPEGPGCYGLDLDGSKHFYGQCRYSGLMCKDNAFCSFRRPKKEI